MLKANGAQAPSNPTNATWGRGYTTGSAIDDLVVGSSGSEQLYGGLGLDVLVGNGGADTFIVHKGEGDDAIADFVSGDVIRLKAGFTNFAQVQAAMTQQGLDVRLNLGDSASLVIRNTSIAQFTAQDFQLELDPSSLGTMTFADEFNSLSIWDAVQNPTGTWRPDYGYNGEMGVGSYTIANNGEQQIYTSPYFMAHKGDFNDGNFRLNADGTLTLIAHDTTNPEIKALGYDYSSALISTRGTAPWMPGGMPNGGQFNQTYGYFEIRADVPEVPGAWGAFWMMRDDWAWPPEIDILESPIGDANLAWATTHTASTGTHTAQGLAAYVPGQTTGFHTYGALWTPQTITYYIDRVAVFQTATPADMHSPMHLIANLAVGGWADRVSGTFRAEMTIDYIRAWSLPTPGENVPPPIISLEGGTISKAEGSRGSTEFAWTITRTGDLSGTSRVQLTSDIGSGATGIAGTDDFGFIGGGTITFASGESSKRVVFTARGDTALEQDESFNLSLQVLQGGTVATSKAKGIILNDDQAGITQTGTGKNDNITGSAWNDQLSGGRGNDTLAGLAGDDRLSGGRGNDGFLFSPGTGSDTVTDFVRGQDKLIFSGYGPEQGVLRVVGVDSVIRFLNGDQVTLLGVTGLTSGDWQYV